MPRVCSPALSGGPEDTPPLSIVLKTFYVRLQIIGLMGEKNV